MFKNYVYVSEYREGAHAALIHSEDWVKETTKRFESFFAQNKDVLSVDIKAAPQFTLLVEKYDDETPHIHSEDGVDYIEYDYEDDGWRFKDTTISRYGDIWIRFYEKFGEDGCMEVKIN